MELHSVDDQHSGIFKRSEDFEIDEHPFREIQIDDNRVTAKGKSWETFEVLISFIGAAWMEKWRRFGTKLLAGDIFLLGLPFFAIIIPGFAYIFWGAEFVFMLPLMLLGIIPILVWALVKQEALKIYTPGAVFKIGGSSGLVEGVWKAITSAQRARDV